MARKEKEQKQTKEQKEIQMWDDWGEKFHDEFCNVPTSEYALKIAGSLVLEVLTYKDNPKQADDLLHNVRRLLLWRIKEEYPFLPHIPADWIGLKEWIIDTERVLAKATTIDSAVKQLELGWQKLGEAQAQAFEATKAAKEETKKQNKGVDALIDEIETALGNAADPKGVEGVIEVLKSYLPELLSFVNSTERFAGLMWTIRYILVDYKSKYPFMPTLPVDVAGVQEWIIDFERASVKATKEPKNAGDTNKPKKKLKPLSANAAAVYELLKALLEYKAMKGREILKALENQNPSIFIDQSTLTKNIIPELKPYGVKNRPRIGYYIER